MIGGSQPEERGAGLTGESRESRWLPCETRRREIWAGWHSGSDPKFELGFDFFFEKTALELICSKSNFPQLQKFGNKN
jgi:hypothetical protein